MWRMGSLLWRIIGLHVLVLGAAAVALPLAIYFLLNDTAAGYENSTLRAHADTIASYLSPAPGGGWTLALPEDLRTFYLRGFDGFAYSVIDANGRVQSSSLKGGAAILRLDRRAAGPVYFSRHEGKATYYGASIPERRHGRTVWIEVAQDLQHPDVIVDDIVADFLSRFAWFTLPILLLILVADILIVHRALRPVVHASELAGTIDPARLDLRLPERDIPREILPLVHAVNQALHRIELGFRTLREFTADAAHELRTPLSVLRLRVDTALPPDAAQALLRDIDAMSHVVDQLLAAAELEGIVVSADDRADLGAVAADVVALLAPIAVAQGKDIALSAPPGPVHVHANGPLLFQAIRNLAENALAHTPEGTTVEIAIDGTGAIRVLDEGTGIAEGEKGLIFQRFWRRAHSKGAGLGLAIVRRIVEAHGGRVTAENRAPRGAVFTIFLRSGRQP